MTFFSPSLLKIRKYQNAILFMGILILAFILRIIHLGANQLALDEPFSVFHAQMSVSGLIASLKGLNNPPLNEIILHFWIRLFGISPFSVRFPSLLFGTLNLYVIYLLVRKFFDEKIAFLALLMVAFSNYQLYFSHEARVYALFALLTTWSFLLFLKIVKEGAKKLDYILLYLCYSLLIFAHYFGWVVLLLQIGFIFLLLDFRQKKIVRYSLVLLGVLVTYLPYLPELFSRFSDSAQHGTWLKPVENLGNLHDLILIFANSNRLVYLLFILLIWGGVWKFFYLQKLHKIIRWGILFGLVPFFFLTSYSIFFSIPFFWKLTSMLPYIFFFLGIIVIVYGLCFLKWRDALAPQLIIFGWFLLPFLLFFGVSFYMPIFLDRYLVFVMPAFYISLALSLFYLVPPKFFRIAAGILILAMLVSFTSNESNKRDVKSLVNRADSLQVEGSKLFICPEQFQHTFAYHFDRSLFCDWGNFETRLESERVFFIYNDYDVDDLLSSDDSLLIFIDARGQFLYPDNGIIERLTEVFGEGVRYEFQDSMYVYQFGKSFLKN